jgi:hypothetical protein
VPVLQLLDRDRIVEVAGVFAVDRDHRAITEIGAAGDVLLLDRGADALRLGDGLGTVRVRNAVLAENDFGVDTGIVDVAQHFDNASRRPTRRARPARDFDRHHLARLRVMRLAARNLDVGGQSPVERRDESKAGRIDGIAADDGRGRAFENLDDLSFGAPVFAIALDAHDDAIAVHGFPEVVLGHVDVARQALDGPFGRDESEPGRVAVQLADHEVHAIGQPVAVAFDLDQRPVVNEVPQVALEDGPLVAGDLQDAQQFARCSRMRHTLPHEAE